MEGEGRKERREEGKKGGWKEGRMERREEGKKGGRKEGREERREDGMEGRRSNRPLLLLIVEAKVDGFL